MKILTYARKCSSLGCLLLAIAVLMMGPAKSLAEPPGVDIKVRAQNRSTADTPFCNVGEGSRGDRLDVDAFMTPNGAVTGHARFEASNGTVTMFNIDTVLGFDGGMVLQDLGDTGYVVAIWMNSLFDKPTLVNVETPRGCINTISTFTPGVDKVTVQIKIR